jgi:hypothetical protein
MFNQSDVTPATVEKQENININNKKNTILNNCDALYIHM